MNTSGAPLNVSGASKHTLLHQAIDQLSAALAKVQLLERKPADTGELPEAVDEIVAMLIRVGDLLHQAQDHPGEARH